MHAPTMLLLPPSTPPTTPHPSSLLITNKDNAHITYYYSNIDAVINMGNAPALYCSIACDMTFFARYRSSDTVYGRASIGTD